MFVTKADFVRLVAYHSIGFHVHGLSTTKSPLGLSCRSMSDSRPQVGPLNHLSPPGSQTLLPSGTNPFFFLLGKFFFLKLTQQQKNGCRFFFVSWKSTGQVGNAAEHAASVVPGAQMKFGAETVADETRSAARIDYLLPILIHGT